MQPLATTFDEGRFHYTQLERQGDIALFQQQHKEAPGVIRFEVVRIRIQAEHTWPNGNTTPEREAYPGSTLWGRYGWTFFTLGEAQALMQGESVESEGLPVEDTDPEH